jgi:N-methylhydantoinase A
MRFRVGVDIGGTFSDLVVLADDGRVSTLKVSSAPERLMAGLGAGLRGLLGEAGLAAGEAAVVVHGTTTATNAILEYRGARTGLITTRGFRDVLEIRRLRVGRLYDLGWEKPEPLVPRRLRFEVAERLNADGEVVTPLDLGGARRAVEVLVAGGVEAIAVSLLHAYANGEHERRIGEIVAERAPGMHLSLSHEVLPEAGEYERTSTTVLNAYVAPVLDRYLGTLERALSEVGLEGPLLMMQSNGGVMRAATARERPINVVESGPAAGVVAALQLARSAGYPNVITIDMGGTTAKASIVEDGRAFQMTEYEVGAGINAGSRLFKGGGHLLRVPALDIAEVGSGGGSLIRVDAGGGLRVGPESAGAQPGPVCYGLGNQQPTLTDANLILGYLNPTHLLGGTMAIDADAAARALWEQVARPLGLELLEAAYGAHLVAVSSMVRVARAVSTERGRDPRRCTLVAFGGNGPVHGAEVARLLGIRQVVIPAWPGLFSALGLLFAEPRHELVQAHRRPLADARVEELADGLESLERAARTRLAAEGYPAASATFERLLDLRYRGQSSELRIPLGDHVGDGAIERVAERFQEEHAQVYGHQDRVDRIEVVNLRLVARAHADPPPDRLSDVRGERADDRRARTAYFGREHGPRETAVVGRAQLGARARPGPLIVEEYDATTVVPPDWTGRLDRFGNIVLELGGPS